MIWKQLIGLVGRSYYTKQNERFTVVRVTENTNKIRIESSQKIQTISRTNLEKAIQIVADGTILRGPGDYRVKVADERPTYAWAILRHIKIV